MGKVEEYDEGEKERERERDE
jgi:hypothetical protein